MEIVNDLEFVADYNTFDLNDPPNYLEQNLKELEKFLEIVNADANSKDYRNAEENVRLLVKKSRTAVLFLLGQNPVPGQMDLMEVLQDLTERLEEPGSWQADFQDSFGYTERLAVYLEELRELVSEIKKFLPPAPAPAAAPAAPATPAAAPAAAPAPENVFFRLPMIIDQAVEKMISGKPCEPERQELEFARLFLAGARDEAESLPQDSAPGLELHRELARQLKSDLKKLGCEGSKAPRDVQQILSKNAEVILGIQKGSAAHELCDSKTGVCPDAPKLLSRGLGKFFDEIKNLIKINP